MPRPFSEPERDVIRRQLRESAQRLFETRGLRKTSIDEIVRAAGISKGAFYLFYPSKEALCLDVLEGIEAELRNSVLEQTLVKKGNARRRVGAILQGFLTSWEAYPLLRTFDQADYAYLVRRLPPEQARAHAARDNAFIEMFTQKLKREGLTVKASPRVVVNLLRSLFWVGLHRQDLGEADYADTMTILTDLVAAHITGGAR